MAPNTTPLFFRISSASIEKTPPDELSFRTLSFLLMHAYAYGTFSILFWFKIGHTFLHKSQLIHNSCFTTGYAKPFSSPSIVIAFCGQIL